MSTPAALIIGIIIGFAIARIIPPHRRTGGGQTKLTTKKSLPSDERIIPPTPRLWRAGKKSEKEKQKNKNLDEVLSYLKEHKEISNNNIEELLKVSDATATRYLDKLEEQGDIEQIGEKGRYVKYKLK